MVISPESRVRGLILCCTGGYPYGEGHGDFSRLAAAVSFCAVPADIPIGRAMAISPDSRGRGLICVPYQRISLWGG